MDFNKPFLELNDLWAAVQFNCIYRWEHFRMLQLYLTGSDTNWRSQSTAQHVVGLHELAYRAIDVAKFPLDGILVVRAISKHDRGEPGSKNGDVNFKTKNATDDCNELAAFDREIADQPEESKNADRKAFLLQFVTSGMYWHLFTDDDQHVLESLRDNRWREAHLLRFLEHVDYVHYVLDNWLRTNVPYPLTWGLRTALDYIPAFAADLPDIAPTLWPAAMQRFAEQWVSEHADVPEEDDVFNEIQRLNSVTEG